MFSQNSPRNRRLKADFEAIKQLDQQSSILSFESKRNPPEKYLLTFRGLGVWRMQSGEIALRDVHQVAIELAAAYPRLIPNMAWKTPIFHPNISSSGVICLGGYGTNWVPSLTLDELCGMLWDMIRYKNFDTESPYNKDAAIWAKTTTQFDFPLDHRPIRDLVSGDSKTASAAPVRNVAPPPVVSKPRWRKRSESTLSISTDIPIDQSASEDDGIQIVEAKVVESPSDEQKNPDQDIMFID